MSRARAGWSAVAVRARTRPASAPTSAVDRWPAVRSLRSIFIANDVGSSLRVDCATRGHLRVVTDLLAEAVEWLGDRGVDQWPSPYPGPIVRASIPRGNTYVASFAGDPVATLSFRWGTPAFWGARP